MKIVREDVDAADVQRKKPLSLDVNHAILILQ
jgi:hypothetical protein